MTFTDTFITVLVLAGLFLLAYSSIKQQRLIDTVNEIKDMFKDKATEAIEKTPMRYSN